MTISILNNSSPIQQGRVSTWLTKYGLSHRVLGLDYQGIEIIEVKPDDWPSVAVSLYIYGFNYLRCQCVYDVSPGGLLASVYHLTNVQDIINQPEEVCIKIFVTRNHPIIPSSFWIWKTADFQERESYDMFGIVYQSHPHLKRILMPESWLGWPLRKDYITPNYFELQNAY
jgi:NAD(P)H-quinone oxidoreductase subunit J